MRAALRRFLAEAGHGGAALGVRVADDADLRALNRGHRGTDAPTDVLAWPYLGLDDADGLLGELAVSMERATAQAAENGWDAATELLRLLAHGTAHLAGHDHQTAGEERAMLALERRMLSAVGLTGIYPE